MDSNKEKIVNKPQGIKKSNRKLKKYRNRIIPKGIQIKDERVWIRIFPNGPTAPAFVKHFGSAKDPENLDLAISTLNRYRRNIAHGKFDAESKEKRIKVSEAISLFKKIHVDHMRRGSTYKWALDTFEKYFSFRYWDDIKPSDIRYFRGEEQKRISVASVNRYQTTIVCMYNKLKEAKINGDIDPIKMPKDNPCATIKKPIETESIRNRVLTFEEYFHLRKIAIYDRNFLDILDTSLQTLLRCSDLKTLSHANVHNQSNRLRGIQSKTQKPFSIFIIAPLRKLIDKTPRGKFLLNFKNFRKKWEKYTKLANFDKPIQFRDMRRTGATWIYRAGVPLNVVSRYLGHQTISMTERYIGFDSNDAINAGEIMEKLFIDPNYTKKGQDDPIKGNSSIDPSKIPWFNKDMEDKNSEG